MNVFKALQDEKFVGKLDETPEGIEVEILYNDDGSIVSHLQD